MITVEKAKSQAKILKSFLEKKSVDISHSACLQVIAQMNGFSDWNTMSVSPQKIDNPLVSSTTHGLCLEWEILDGVVRELLEQVCGFSRNSKNFSIQKNQYGNTIGFEINNGKQYIEINNDVQYSHSDEKSQKLLLGIQLADTLVKLIIDQLEGLKFRKAYFSLNDMQVVKLAEKDNALLRINKARPVLKFEDNNFEQHFKLLEVKNFLAKQKPVGDPRVFYLKIKEILTEHFYVGYGGTHIHIKSKEDNLKVIAFIIGGLNNLDAVLENESQFSIPEILE